MRPFRLLLFDLAFGVGFLAVAVVSLRPFLVLSFGVASSCVPLLSCFRFVI